MPQDIFRDASSGLRVIDSHTAGEPTRIVVAGMPDLGRGSMAERRAAMRERCDWIRTALVCEPRGAEWMVGAVLQEPLDPQCAAGIIFFNNAGYLNMCGHGTLGLVATLAYLGRIESGWHRIETPVGEVRARLAPDGSASVENVRSYRHRKAATVTLPDGRTVTGDVAWGGNWFFLVSVPQPLRASQIDALTSYARQVRDALDAGGITGEGGAPIDHIEFVGPPSDAARADGRSFVLCPGGLYDRSPCGTGLSAKAACLAADGKLQPGQVWRQESILGGIFSVAFRDVDGGVVPTISGQAFVNGDLQVVIHPDDPYRHGFQPSLME